MNKKMLRKKLALMLANLKKKRPFYTELEYLESTGTQWINTGVLPANEMEFECKFTFTSLVSSNLAIIGSRDGDKRCQPIGVYNNRWSASIGGSYDANGTSVSANTPYMITSTITNGQTITTNVNGSQASTCTSTTGLPAQELYIFGRNFYGNIDPVDSRVNGKLYFLKIKSNGILVRDFIPVLDWNMTPCMYDKVTEQLFYNQGTGDFIAGREIHYVEYLERPVDAGIGSSMWINTGLKYFADFEVGVSLRKSVSNTCLGTSSVEKLERINATYPQWKFTSAAIGAYSSNISVVGYHELKWKDGKIYADGVQLTTKAKTSTASTNPMVLFGIPTSATTAIAYHNIIYFCKLWHPTDGTLVRDYLPAIDENDTYFMFDKVSHTCYNNAGTGSFVGPTVQKDGNGKIIENEYE